MGTPMASQSGAERILESEPREPEPSRPTGLVDLFLDYSKDLPSPAIFRKWTAIHAVGASAERRVWTQFGRLRLHPNLFVFLVGPPGTGKTVALNPMAHILRKAQSVALAPNDITKQGLLDKLGESGRGAMINGRPFDYHFLALHIAELSNFMSQYDAALAGLLTDLFDCPDANDEHKRGHDKGKLIEFPGISMIVGTATQNLGSTISTEMWGSGFMARVIMVYSSDEVIPKDMFAKTEDKSDLEVQLVGGLRRLGDLVGPMEWTAEAREMLNTFRQDQANGAPLHNRLEHYVRRRTLHLAKLCMIAALSHESMTVNADDFASAYNWLVSAESDVTEIFKDLQSHEDGQVHEELRSTMFQVYCQTRKPIPAGVIFKYLSKRVATHNVKRVVEVAEAADYLRRVAGTSGDDALYIPQPPSGTINLGVL